MRVRLKGLNSVPKTLADGSKRTYWYAWKGGPPLASPARRNSSTATTKLLRAR
jgi:hypothetical protein